MALYRLWGTFRLFAFFSFFLISILLLPVKPLRAQVTCGNAGNACPNGDADCDDSNPCNGAELCFASGGGDTFSAPTCHCAAALPPDNTVSCASDGTFCNGTEQCVAGTCTGHTGDPCSGTECNNCNETANNCFDPNTTACTSDGNICTDDFCNGLGTCVNTPNTAPCDDGVNCTAVDVCTGGACNGTAVLCIDDGISCTLESCDEPSGICVSDNSTCECQTDADCDDSNPCTDEFCDANLTCVRSNNTNACNDGLFCNGTDICQGGTCSNHSGDPCSTGDQCDQICNEAADNCFDPNGSFCDDGTERTATQCDGNGTCIVTGIEQVEGSGTLHCSLNPREEQPFGLSSIAWMVAGLIGLLVVRQVQPMKSKAKRN